MNEINKPFLARWATNLRSGEYEQGKYHLHRHDAYCVIGVGVLTGYSVIQHQSVTYAISSITALSGLPVAIVTMLMRANDSGETFENLARALDIMAKDRINEQDERELANVLGFGIGSNTKEFYSRDDVAMACSSLKDKINKEGIYDPSS